MHDGLSLSLKGIFTKHDLTCLEKLHFEVIGF